MEGFPGISVVKNPPTNAGAAGLIPGSGRANREGNDNPLQVPLSMGKTVAKPSLKIETLDSRNSLLFTLKNEVP